MKSYQSNSRPRGPRRHLPHLIRLRQLVVAVLVLATAAVLVACGSSGRPDAEHLRERTDELKSELLLTKSEIARAEASETERDGSLSSTGRSRSAFRRARHIERVCREGDGLEPCEALSQIEDVVNSIR